MKTIKVFIASSEELKEERLELLSIEKRINENLEPHGVRIKIIEWEFLDPELSPTRKQDDYNDELKTCDICCVICWQKFGKYTAEEFRTAHEVKASGGPLHKIYIFFKEPGEYSDELKAFKKGIEKDYGHFPSCFETVDAFRFAIYDILNREALKWIKGNAGEELGSPADDTDDDVDNPDADTASQVEAYTVRNSKIEINGEVQADFLSLPFAKNNARYTLLRQEVELLEQVLPVYLEAVEQQADNETLSTKYQQLCDDLTRKKNLLHSMEYTMLKTYCGLVQYLAEHNSVRVKRAFKLFNQGNDAVVTEVLDANQLNQDLDNVVRQLSEARKKLSDTIGEYQLKIDVLKARKEKDWAKNCATLYRKATDAARDNIPEAEFAKLLTEFAVFLQTNAQDDDAIKAEWHQDSEKLFKEAMPIWESLSARYPEQYLDQRAHFLNKYAILQKKLKRREEAEKLYTEAINLYSQLAESDPTYRANAAQVRGNRANVYRQLKQSEKAEREYLAVINDYRQIAADSGSNYDKHIARNLINLGIFYKNTLDNGIGTLEKALKALDEAFQLRSKLAESDPDTYQYSMAIVLRIKAETYNAAKKYADAYEFAGQAASLFSLILQRLPSFTKAQRKYCLVLSERALYAARAGHFEEAESYARQSMKMEAEYGLFSEERAAPMKNLGYALLFQGNVEEAKEWLLKAAKKQKDSGKLWKETILEELDKFKNEKLVEQDRYDDLNAVVAELNSIKEDDDNQKL